MSREAAIALGMKYNLEQEIQYAIDVLGYYPEDAVNEYGIA